MDLVTVRLSADGPAVVAALQRAEPGDLSGASVVRAADVLARLEATEATIESALDTVVTPTAQTVMSRLADLKPTSIDLEFGLQISGRAGLVFASAQGEVHFTVRLRWEPER